MRRQRAILHESAIRGKCKAWLAGCFLEKDERDERENIMDPHCCCSWQSSNTAHEWCCAVLVETLLRNTRHNILNFEAKRSLSTALLHTKRRGAFRLQVDNSH